MGMTSTDDADEWFFTTPRLTQLHGKSAAVPAESFGLAKLFLF